MIAIGSNIGTGLFIGSGAALQKGGPAALILAFALIGCTLFIMMQCLGEMTVVLPVSGSFTRYANRFVERGLGFAMGWQYWLCWVSVFAAEATAANIIMQYWTTSVPPAVWISIFILINLAVHAFPVRLFGEVEFYVSTLKVISVLIFIVVMWVIMAGGGPDGRKHGGENWVDPGALMNGFPGIAAVFVTAAFSCGGTEMVGIVAGESAFPRYNIPRAIRTLMWRILIFYITSLLFITFVVRADNPRLLGGSSVSASPFVVAIEGAGIAVLPHILNAVVLVCVCSVGSVSIYISSRVLLALAEDEMAFKAFARTDRQGRPYMAIAFTGLIAAGISYLNVDARGAEVFSWFTSISGMAFFLAWMVIIVCNWRFHAALKAQGDTTLERRFAYRATLWPWMSIAGFVAIVFMVGCQFYVCLYPVGGAAPDPAKFFSGFIGVPIFLVMWAGYRVVYRTSFIALKDIDLQTGRRSMDPVEEKMLEDYAALPLKKRLISYFHF
ncbi:AAT family amino acid transporter [Peziza echinospora]|nr:AAT family amino acid transporter [Peziza echinospora]